MTPMTPFEVFDRVEIIHLPSRIDRFNALRKELSSCNFDISKALIPEPFMAADSNGFPSRAIYGNFLSHLDIIRRAYRDGLSSVLILEDDAIFSNRFKRDRGGVSKSLESPWDIVYIGHSILSDRPRGQGMVPFDGDLIWAHCYGVHRNIMPRLIDFLEGTIDSPAGCGGKMYIDGALNTFRKSTTVRTLISSPCMSVQRGSDSNISERRQTNFSGLTSFARKARDRLWRHGLISISHKG